MKKSKITLIFLSLILLTGLSAEAKFGFGPKVGLNVDKMSSKGFDSSDRCGVTAGLTAEYIAPMLGLGADISLMYTYMTNEVDGQEVYGNFFEIPLHLKYKIGIPAVSSYLSPYVFTGPSVAFKLGGKDSYGDTKATQWGWDLGIGLELIKHLQIGAGYTFGINNIARNFDSAGEVTNIKVRNNYWTVTAAWMF